MSARRGVWVATTSVLAALAILGAAGYLLNSAVPSLFSYFSTSIKTVSGVTEKPVSEPFVHNSSQTVTSSLVPELESLDGALKPVKVSLLPSEEELRQYALDLINSDRAAAGLPPVTLTDNYAAQAQADDIVATGHLSHWMTDGEKPYMSYSRYGGTGYVSQNAAICCYAQQANHSAISDGVLSGHFFTASDIKQAIEVEQDGMVNDDLACCSNGHRMNILDAHHTGVSIGIAYSNNSVVMVQNFENRYLALDRAISSGDNKLIEISGSYIRPGYQIAGITITFDKAPSHAAYQENFNEHSYGSGELLATVQKPAPPGYHYQSMPDHFALEAGRWQDTGAVFDVRFDMSGAVSKDGPGMYTLTAFLTSEGGRDVFPALTYSVYASAPQ